MAGFLNKVLSFAGVYPSEDYADDADVAYGAEAEDDEMQNVGYGTYGAYGSSGGNVINQPFRNPGGAGSVNGGPQQMGGKGASNVVNMHGAKSDGNYVLVSAKPERYEDAQEICDHLKERHVVIINLERMESDLAQRTVDFISGSVYALDGEIIKFSRSLIGIAPSNVNLVKLSGDPRNKDSMSFMGGYRN
ncbi:MAG: cell division protein SepF [Clostridiales bacterium]|nr:cell division protein SepF [Clostridiales bacterium]